MHGYDSSKIPRLFELMEQRQIRAKDISAATGISAGSITDWKNGKSVPSGERLLALANFFDVTAEYLLGTDADQNAMDMKIQAEAKQLSENQKADVLKYIEFIKTKE